jgi:hypothetical protein
MMVFRVVHWFYRDDEAYLTRGPTVKPTGKAVRGSNIPARERTVCVDSRLKPGLRRLYLAEPYAILLRFMFGG